jgi:hypothetical protein
VWSHIIQPKSGQTKFNGLTNVWPSTGEIWLKTSRLTHAVYRWCIVTLIIAHVLCNVSLENVTFESRSVSSCSSSLMSRSILWPEYAMIFGTGHSHKRLRPHLHIILHVYNSNFKQSIRFLATITMKRRLHSCRIVNMQKYVGAVCHRGLALRVATI